MGVEPALAVLPQLRKAALQTGNRRALVEYHLSLARVSAIRDWWGRARAQIEVASGLLEIERRLDQLWQLRQVQATMATKECQLATAKTHAEEALTIARTIGSVPFEASSLANLAHLTALLGRYHEARSYVDQASRLLAPLSHLRFALYATQIDVGLWSSENTAYARAAVEAGEHLGRHSEGSRFYHRLWFELQHGRWLLQEGDYVGAASLAVSASKDIEALADTNLLFRMRMLAAEATANTSSIQAAVLMADFPSTVSRELSIEGLAELNRLSSVLAREQGATTEGLMMRKEIVDRLWADRPSGRR